MREIKFRAWDKQNKRMFYNVACSGIMPLSLTNDETAYTEWYTCEQLDLMKVKSINDIVILMQYTGLKDKNGKEIYEGDIVRNPITSEIATVEFEEGGFCTHFYPTIEVIGNIYENPEFLKEKNT